MASFLRWLVSALFIAAVFGVVAGGFAKTAAYVPVDERDASVPAIKYENEQDEVSRAGSRLPPCSDGSITAGGSLPYGTYENRTG